MPKFQCYSAVVARSSCSSVSDAFSEKSGPTPALYSQKAAPLAYSSTERGTVTKLPLTLIVLGASEPRLSGQQAPVPGKSENIDTSRFQPFCSSGSVEIVIICLAAVIVSGNIMLLNIVVETAVFDKYTIRKRDDGLLVPSPRPVTWLKSPGAIVIPTPHHLPLSKCAAILFALLSPKWDV